LSLFVITFLSKQQCLVKHLKLLPSDSKQHHPTNKVPLITLSPKRRRRLEAYLEEALADNLVVLDRTDYLASQCSNKRYSSSPNQLICLDSLPCSSSRLYLVPQHFSNSKHHKLGCCLDSQHSSHRQKLVFSVRLHFNNKTRLFLVSSRWEALVSSLLSSNRLFKLDP
jgi:hypothetical protein